MAKHQVSSIPSIRTVYRIPTRAVYNRKRIDTGKSWKDLYGKARCQKCKQNFREGDAYEVIGTDKHRRVICRHVECPK
jgi:hypothetical protein